MTGVTAIWVSGEGSWKRESWTRMTILKMTEGKKIWG
jgi:hypothetical protein